MLGEHWEWAVGLLVTLGLAVIGAFRNLAAKMSDGDAKLHKRIDDVKDNYVRRADLDDRLEPLNTQVRELRGELKDYNERVIDALADLRQR